MKKIMTFVIISLFSVALFASDIDSSIGVAGGIYMNFGAVEIENGDSNHLALTAGAALSPTYDLTVDNGKTFTYGMRARGDFLIGVDEPDFFQADIFIGPKGTIAFSDKARLNLAIGGTLGYSIFEATNSKDELLVSKTLSWGFGPDLYFDYDITDSFGIGIGYIGKINYDFGRPFNDRIFLLSSDVYLSAYYSF